ncbi:hypothetical protein SEVIR_3G298950v4 [Setaria viridis]
MPKRKLSPGSHRSIRPWIPSSLIQRLNKHMECSVLENVVGDQGLLLKPESVAARPSAELSTDGPIGHRDDLLYRDQGLRSMPTFVPGPAKGTAASPPPFLPPKFHGPLYESSCSRGRSVETGHRYGGKLPKISFPTFDGYNPRLWISRCEIYFDMYHVEPDAWIRVASMHLSPVVACWFQSVERKFPTLTWPHFCLLLHEWFGKDQQQLLIR